MRALRVGVFVVPEATDPADGLAQVVDPDEAA
jgi:hypothetical protein